jgi:dTDP-4-amino-4,6-dideoxygalactose transaminase
VSRIYLSPPHVMGNERELVLEAIDSNWVAPLGPHVDAFEREFAALHGVPAAAALSSGTAGLHLALILLGVGAGDEVLVPTLTFSASANAVTYVGATPVFVDVHPDTWTVDPALVVDELDRRARSGRLPAAVITVDLYGQCADADPIIEACAAHGVPIIEDAAEALGATYRDRPAGTMGRFGVFSFNGNKIVTTSGGGMLISSDIALVERTRFLATQARDPAPHYEHSTIGFNYRLSNLLAAVGRAQLATLAERVTRRRAVNQHYRTALADLSGLAFMPQAAYGTPTCWLTCATIDPATAGVTRDDVIAALSAADIEARPVWKPMHLQPVFAGCPAVGGDVAGALFRDGLCLPSGSDLSADDLERVAAVVRAAFGRSGGRVSA